MKPHNLKVINLYGTCGSGKSSVASGLFYLMKIQGYSVELITEFAKEMVWERQHPSSFTNQVYISAKQHNKQLNLVGHGIDYAVTDSPLLLSAMYMPNDYYVNFMPLLFEMNDAYDNINILLNRTVKFNPIGRNQKEEESIKIQEDIIKLLNDNNIQYHKFDATPDTANEIFELIGNIESCYTNLLVYVGKKDTPTASELVPFINDIHKMCSVDINSMNRFLGADIDLSLEHRHALARTTYKIRNRLSNWRSNVDKLQIMCDGRNFSKNFLRGLI